MKLTQWFPGHIKPVRVGVYQRKYQREVLFCWWDGAGFGFPGDDPSEAIINRRIGRSAFQNLPWRGVAK